MPTVAQLKERARAHNKVHCIKLSQRKAGLMSALAKSTAGSGAGASGASGAGAGAGAGNGNKKKKRVKQKAKKNMLSPAQVEQLVNASGASGAGAGAGAGNENKKKKRIKPVLASPLAGAGALASASGGTVGQKNFAKKMSKMQKAYQKLGGKDANEDLAF